MEFPLLASTTATSRIRFLNKRFGIETFNDWHNLDNVDEIINSLSTSAPSRKTQMFHIVYYLKQIPAASNLLEEYEDRLDNIVKDAINIIENNTFESDTRSENYLKLSELKEKLKTVPDGQDKIILGLYILNPPLRNNYGNANIITRKADIVANRNNVIVSNRSVKLFADQHKTVSSFGPIDVGIDKETSRLIRKFGFPIHSEDQFRKRVKKLSLKYFNKPIGIDDFRHIYEIDLQSSDKYKNMTIAQKKKEHHKLYHSMPTALLYNRI